MDLSMLFYAFLPFAKQNQAEVVACWSFCFELKALNESKYWQCFLNLSHPIVIILESFVHLIEKIITLWRLNCWKYLDCKIEVCRMGPLFIIIWHHWTGGNFLNQNHIILHLPFVVYWPPLTPSLFNIPRFHFSWLSKITKLIQLCKNHFNHEG